VPSGALCRFDGRCAADERVVALAGRHTLIPVCPEIYGGLPTPRPPGEIRDGRVIDRTGLDVTEAYARGAEAALAFARLPGCHPAVLKARSPSCGAGQIYDGHFSGRLVPGDGLTAALLKKAASGCLRRRNWTKSADGANGASKLKLISFLDGGRERVGRLEGDRVLPIEGYDSMLALIRAGARPESLQTLAALPFSSVELLAPIPEPAQDILCLGLNYRAHAEESPGSKGRVCAADAAVYFSKRVNRALPSGRSIEGHADLDAQLDYEVELAVVIGRDARNVPMESAFEYIFGYTILNDVSARTLQDRHRQWYFGKSLDGFAPMGPCIVTEDEFDRPPALAIRSYVNGENPAKRQHGRYGARH
jgi:2-keto-4-pentenoate hydratase/2-oxohepta-3-ene-1,7-dioic acid hydratase in catechol pathway/uncharacterized protein YbbK (DUF523 family)